MTKRPVAGITIALALALGLLAAWVPRAPEVIRGQRVELVGPTGQLQATLAADSAGVVLTLVDRRGHPRASLRLDGDPRLTVLGATGREVAGLGAPRAHHLTE